MKNLHELSGNALLYQNALFKLLKHTITNESSLNINTSLPKATQKVFKDWSVETIYFFLETCKLLPWNDEEQKKRYFEPNKLQQFNDFVALKNNERLKKELKPEAAEKLKKEEGKEGEEEVAKFRKEQEAKENKEKELRKMEEKQKIMEEEAAKRTEANRSQQRLEADRQRVQQQIEEEKRKQEELKKAANIRSKLIKLNF